MFTASRQRNELSKHVASYSLYIYIYMCVCVCVCMCVCVCVTAASAILAQIYLLLEKTNGRHCISIYPQFYSFGL